MAVFSVFLSMSINTNILKYHALQDLWMPILIYLNVLAY